MVGELEVVIVDQNASIEFLGDHILLRFSNLRGARSATNVPRPVLELIARLLSFIEVRLLAKLGKQNPVELFPRPAWFVRLFSPTVREMVRLAK